MQGQISGPGPHGQNSHADRSGVFGRAGLDQKSALAHQRFKEDFTLGLLPLVWSKHPTTGKWGRQDTEVLDYALSK